MESRALQGKMPLHRGLHGAAPRGQPRRLSRHDL